MSKAELDNNIAGITATIKRIVGNSIAASESCKSGSFEIVDNMSWYSQWNFVQFLSTIGPQFRVKTMLGKQTVKERLESENDSLTFLEFT